MNLLDGCFFSKQPTQPTTGNEKNKLVWTPVTRLLHRTVIYPCKTPQFVLEQFVTDCITVTRPPPKSGVTSS